MVKQTTYVPAKTSAICTPWEAIYSMQKHVSKGQHSTKMCLFGASNFGTKTQQRGDDAMWC